MDYKNSYFQVIPKDNGTFLKIFPALEGGEKLRSDEIKKYLDNCGVKNYTLHEVAEHLCDNEEREFKISEVPIYPIAERLEVLFDKGRTIGVARFYPPSPKGRILDKNDIIDELRKKGIVHGLLMESIEQFINHRIYCTNICVAKATPPIEGKNAEIEYFFNVETTSKPRVNEDGSVDFHHLDNMSRVNQGDLLAKLTPADRGTPGSDIMGVKLMPKRVKQRMLKKTQHTEVSEDGLSLYSLVSGHATLVDDKVFVSDVYEVAADVDASTGDIDYGGNVTVHGNVRTGYTIKAQGNIIVNGVVEGATLIAEGEIILKRGIQGMNRGILEAKGNVVTKFIENSTVKSGGNITTEAIMHSVIEAKNDIVVAGKRGLVTGGELKAGSNIVLKVAGSMMGTTTVLEVGVNMELSERYHEVESRIDAIKKEKTLLEQDFFALKKKVMSGSKLPIEKIAFIKSIPPKLSAYEEEMEQLLDEYLNLKEEIDETKNGSVVVQNMVYPGVKIQMSNMVYYVRTEEHHLRYFKSDGEIKSSYL